MTFHAHHGVWDEEREIGQRFEVDVALYLDVKKVAQSDKLKNTIDLYAVFEAVNAVMVGVSYNLVETIAEKIAQKILTDFKVERLTVRVRKPRAPIRGIQDGIEVEIDRQRD